MTGWRVVLIAWLMLLSAADAAEPVRIGVLAYRAQTQTLAQWQPLAEYLKTKIPDREFSIEAFDHAGLEAAVASRNLDFILTNPSHFVLIQRVLGVTAPLATLITQEEGIEQQAFGGVIFTLTERGDINQLQDLRGKRIAMVGLASFGGYQMQAYELVRKGIDPAQALNLRAIGTPHDKVIDEVIAGRADAGFVRSGILESMAREGKLDMARLKILNRQNLPNLPWLVSTRLYPEWPFAALPHIDTRLAGDVTSALFKFHEARDFLQRIGIGGFAIPASYGVVEELLKTLKLPPFAVQPEFTWQDVWHKYRAWIVSLLVAAGIILVLLVIALRSRHRLIGEKARVLQQQRLLEESEHRFRLLTDMSPMAIYLSSDLEQKAEYVNPTFSRLFGYTLDEVSSAAQWWPLAYPDPAYRQQVSEEWTLRIEDAIATQSTIRPMETTVTCKDGSQKIIQWGYTATGRQNWAFGIDVTERRQAEQALEHYQDDLEQQIRQRTEELEQSHLRLQTTQFAMDKAGIGIHWVDVETGRFLYVNEYAAALLGLTCDEMMQTRVQDLDPNFAQIDFQHATQPFREKGFATFETLQQHKDGRLIPIEVTLYYQPGQSASLGSFISFITDITVRKQHEQQLVVARDAAEAANRAKSVFLANMSHELRTPLNAILGFSALMRRDQGLPESHLNTLDIINRSGEHLLTLINDVLEMAKIEAGRIQLEDAAFDLGNMVRDVGDMMRQRAESKGLRLLIDQSSCFPRYIVGDEARLRQVLINLIGNAIKFTAEGGVSLRLGIKPNVDDCLLIEIEDTGIGIAEQDLPNIFEPFVQVGDQGDSKGTGLGLTITRQYVQMMGGGIFVQSRLGKGSLFRVELPLREAEESEVAARIKAQHGEVTGLAPGQPEYRTLIVEDQKENQLLLASLLENVGIHFKIAENGQEAVQLFLEWHPQLIWMDRRMPLMDGEEATRTIRQLPGGLQVKIVAITASALLEQRAELLAAGMDDFVSKPYRFKEIYDCLTRQLGVQFSYARAEAATQVGEPLDQIRLASLAELLRDALKEALESLETDRIALALASVADVDAGLAHTLSSMVERYQYPEILMALSALRRQQSPSDYS